MNGNMNWDTIVARDNINHTTNVGKKEVEIKEEKKIEK